MPPLHSRSTHVAGSYPSSRPNSARPLGAVFPDAHPTPGPRWTGHALLWALALFHTAAISGLVFDKSCVHRTPPGSPGDLEQLDPDLWPVEI